MKMNIKKSNDAVSEVLGTVLLLGMAVSLFSLLSFTVLSFPFNPSSPSVNVVGYIEDTNVTLEHYGGESLDGNITVIISINENSTKIKIDDILNKDDINWSLGDENNNHLWDLGEKLIYYPDSDENIIGEQIEFKIVDIKSNSVILSGKI
jgi:hypothetical protein